MAVSKANKPQLLWLPLIFVIFLSGFPAHSNIQESVVRMTPKQSEEDASHSYLVDVLKLAIKESQPEFPNSKIDFMNIMLGQSLVLELLDIEGVLDVVASAPTPEREQQFRSSRVPLYMGLLGYRMMIIPPQNKQRFSRFTQPSDLKKLKACVGSQWPDADILEEGGYTVVRSLTLDDMYDAVVDGRCDYFPRAITEGYAELDAFNHNNPDSPLVAFDDILIHYDIPFVFYSSHRNNSLSYQIEVGLSRAIERGSLLELMSTHEVTKVVFPLSKWEKAVVFEVDNNNIPMSVRVQHQQYAIKLPVKKILK